VLPTWRRPHRLKLVIDAYRETGAKAGVLCIVNGHDRRDEYEALSVPETWCRVYLPENIGFNAALDWAFKQHPDLQWYGIMSDDCIPKTPEWDRQLVQDLAKWAIVSCNEGWQAKPNGEGRLSPISVFDGNLLRAMGFWFKPELRHYCADDIIEGIGRTFGFWQTRMDIEADHQHYMIGKAENDDTYAISYGDQAAPERERDIAHYRAWMNSRERFELMSRVLGYTLTRKFG